MSLFRPFRSRRDADHSARFLEIRAHVVAAVEANPLYEIADQAARRRLRSGEDVSFDELGLDSLARLALASDLDGVGFAISEREVGEAGSIDGLTRLLMG
jgi:hypothetical protein